MSREHERAIQEYADYLLQVYPYSTFREWAPSKQELPHPHTARLLHYYMRKNKVPIADAAIIRRGVHQILEERVISKRMLERLKGHD